VDRKVKELSPIIQTKLVKADLCEQACNLTMYKRVMAELDGLDVAMLFNNAGMFFTGYLRYEKT
jgi:hypothetical protein